MRRTGTPPGAAAQGGCSYRATGARAAALGTACSSRVRGRDSMSAPRGRGESTGASWSLGPTCRPRSLRWIFGIAVTAVVERSTDDPQWSAPVGPFRRRRDHAVRPSRLRSSTASRTARTARRASPWRRCRCRSRPAIGVRFTGARASRCSADAKPGSEPVAWSAASTAAARPTPDGISRRAMARPGARPARGRPRAGSSHRGRSRRRAPPVPPGHSRRCLPARPRRPRMPRTTRRPSARSHARPAPAPFPGPSFCSALPLRLLYAVPSQDRPAYRLHPARGHQMSRHSSIRTALRSSATCAALTVVTPDLTTGSV